MHVGFSDRFCVRVGPFLELCLLGPGNFLFECLLLFVVFVGCEQID